MLSLVCSILRKTCIESRKIGWKLKKRQGNIRGIDFSDLAGILISPYRNSLLDPLFLEQEFLDLVGH